MPLKTLDTCKLHHAFWNALVSVIYRAHTSIDDFVHDIDAIYDTITFENKILYHGIH